jgi:hypothetical protein
MYYHRDLINRRSLLKGIDGVLQDRASVIERQELFWGFSSHSRAGSSG